MLRKDKLILAASVAACICTGTARADYTDKAAGRITNVLTYDGGHFLITIDPMQQGRCSTYFMVPADVPVDARQMLLSRALIAKSTGELVNIGYDGRTCVNGWYCVHRIG